MQDAKRINTTVLKSIAYRHDTACDYCILSQTPYEHYHGNCI